MAAVFPEVEALPCAECKTGILERDGKIDAGEGAADVRGHVVGAFGGVDEEAVAVGNEACHEGFKIAADVGVGVFLD